MAQNLAYLNVGSSVLLKVIPSIRALGAAFKELELARAKLSEIWRGGKNKVDSAAGKSFWVLRRIRQHES